MLKLLNYNKNISLNNLEVILNKRKSTQKDQTKSVKKIISDVLKNGDKAIIKYEKKFSKTNIKSTKLIFSKKEVNKIAKKIDKKIKQSIDLAFSRIKLFHSKQKFSSFYLKDKYQNKLSYKYSPIEKIGVYVPGGTASYPSTVLMNCIPAIVAGVKNIYLTTPSLDKKINPAIIYAAKKCGVKKIYRSGGAHSIAALAYGTKSFEKVDKIVGPGNAFVANAKKEVFGDVGIDMVAGPSEVTIVADKHANPNWIAADLIAQAEHDIYAQSILITNNFNLIKLVNKCLKDQLKKLPKKNIAFKSLKKFGLAIYSNNRKNIIKIINTIAPEHL
jgi:histidinol dehydrogenase